MRCRGALIFSLVTSVQAEFVHPGLLQTANDFTRITTKVKAEASPWITGWYKLTNSSNADASYKPQAVPIVYRGTDDDNDSLLYEDIAAGYALAIRWKVTGISQYGDAAVNILDAWASSLKDLDGDSDKYLSAGIYGYEFAQVGEIMRDYDGWSDSGFQAFAAMMTDVFVPKIDDWFFNHVAGKYAANAPSVYPGWDLCITTAAVAIGIMTDNETLYDQGVDLFFNGTTNGQVTNAIPHLHTVDNQVLAQTMEAGRDQTHNMLDIALLGALGLMTYNQGDNLLAYNNSIILGAAEYTAKYNLNLTVPYTPYKNSELDLPTISSEYRGDIRPIWELLYNHYGVLKGLNVTWTKQYRDMVVAANGGAEGGGGDYGPNSGGYDQLGWGTLLYTLE